MDGPPCINASTGLKPAEAFFMPGGVITATVAPFQSAGLTVCDHKCDWSKNVVNGKAGISVDFCLFFGGRVKEGLPSAACPPPGARGQLNDF